MRPFSIPDSAKRLRDPYPNSPLLIEVLTGIRRLELLSILRLWFSEGIPFAFKSNPMLYEAVREWMSMRLQVHPKAVTLIGSARIGYSMCPRPGYGREFGANSDLDFSVVDDKLFSEVVANYCNWESDVDAGRAVPRNSREKRFWADNLKRLPDNIARGFIDPYKVPSWVKYPKIMSIMDMLYLLHARLNVTPEAPTVKQATLRVYRDWNAFFQHMCLNISLTVASFIGTNLLTH